MVIMQLIINTWGTLLRVKEGNFLIVAEDKKMELAPRKVSSILVTTGVRLSSDVIQLALEWNIDIVFLDKFGNPYGRIWHCRLGSTTRIRRRQLQVAETAEGVRIVKDLIGRKFDGQVSHFEELRKRRTRTGPILTEAIARLRELNDSLAALRADHVDQLRDTILGIEGSAGKIYFDALSAILPEKYRFEGRSRNPARDFFNCLLNYGYGVLYSIVERACILAGLDPYTGILHTDHYNKKSMVFDLIEPYRVWIDTPVVRLLSGRKVKQDHFDQIKGGYTLNGDGKARLMAALNKYLEEPKRYRGRNIKRRDIVQFDCHRLANQLIKKADPDKVPEQVRF